VPRHFCERVSVSCGPDRVKVMKRALLIAAAAAAGYVAWIKVRQDREERDLWAEVTDSFGETPPARR